MIFASRAFSRSRKRVCVEQVIAAPACYFTVLAAGKKFLRRLLILLVSGKKKKRQFPAVPRYGCQLGNRIGQQRPLLLCYQVSRS